MENVELDSFLPSKIGWRLPNQSFGENDSAKRLTVDILAMGSRRISFGDRIVDRSLTRATHNVCKATNTGSIDAAVESIAHQLYLHREFKERSRGSNENALRRVDHLFLFLWHIDQIVPSLEYGTSGVRHSRHR